MTFIFYKPLVGQYSFVHLQKRWLSTQQMRYKALKVYYLFRMHSAVEYYVYVCNFKYRNVLAGTNSCYKIEPVQ